jgi:hypothetical protein
MTGAMLHSLEKTLDEQTDLEKKNGEEDLA